uniref:C2H2-type domain-containing protein n=1 Tax=Timema cristinae TaxID=61476 RepID=A0A7R9D3D7_TIMCR|nr:unnamed protein product [Timema cristinae]
MDSTVMGNESIHQESSQTDNNKYARKQESSNLQDTGRKSCESDIDTLEHDNECEKLPNNSTDNKPFEVASKESIAINKVYERLKDITEAKNDNDKDCESLDMPENCSLDCLSPNSENSQMDDSDMKFACPICDMILSSQHEFTLHIRSHNNNAESLVYPLACLKNYTCRICGKGLSSSSSLDRHVLVHSGERPFKCMTCGVAFTTNGNMHRHMRTHNPSHVEDSSVLISKCEYTSYESDGSSDSVGSSNSLSDNPRKSPHLDTSQAGPAKRRRVDSDGFLIESNNNTNKLSEPLSSLKSHVENGIKRKASDMLTPPDYEGEEIVRRNLNPVTYHQNEFVQPFQCPVCKRIDFASLYVLETHLEERHPDYKATCYQCDLIFKNHRALNLHRFMAQHDNSEGHNIVRAKKSKHINRASSVLGFRDLTFVDFSSEKFPYIAKVMCEQSMHRATSAFHKFQCQKCARAFPCGSALSIHRQACLTSREKVDFNHTYDHDSFHGDEFPSSDCDTPTDLSSKKKPTQHLRYEKSSDCESEEEQKREDFFAHLDLQTKSVCLSSPLSSEDFRRDERFENDSYFNSVNGNKCDNGKDLADIQSIISVTSAGGLLNDLSKSPQPNGNDITPPDSGIKSSDSGTGEEEQQDCFASEFRKMKLKGEFPCRVCTLVFPNLRALKGHNRVHLTASSGLYRCNMCPYSNIDKGILVRHMRTHNGDRPYECALCNYAFTTKANCERHLRNRHSKLSRDDVKNSIIYHPSEDPINDPEIQPKLTTREDVKRSLVFSTNLSTDETNNMDLSNQSFTEEHQKDGQTKLHEISNRLSFTDNEPNTIGKPTLDDHNEEINHTPTFSVNALPKTLVPITNIADSNNKQIRPWVTHEVATMTHFRDNTVDEVNDIETDSNDDHSDREDNHTTENSNVLVIITKNNFNYSHTNNMLTKLPIHDQRTLKDPIESINPSAITTNLENSYSSDDDMNAPLDLSMDALDLSKKRANEKQPDTVTNINDDFEPQDLSKKSIKYNPESNNKKNLPKQSLFISSRKSQHYVNINKNHNIAQEVYNNLNPKISPPPSPSSNTVPKIEIKSGARYTGSSHINPIYLNNNGFHFSSQSFPLHHYLMPPPPHSLFSNTNIHELADMKERIQKELIRGLQLTSGGKLLDPVTATNKLQAFHQQAIADFSKGNMNSRMKHPEGDIKLEESNHIGPVVDNDLKETSNIVNKNVNKVPPLPKTNRERDSTSVKMIIKNGVLMPKQKQRRYRTERPFACEHCSARFTLRSNMERHIKQQHPQFWSQRQRNSSGSVGRRSHPAAVPTSVNQVLTTQQSQDSRSSVDSFSQTSSKGSHFSINVVSSDPTDYRSMPLLEWRGSEKLPKIEESYTEEVLDNIHKTKDISSVGAINNLNNIAFISEEVRFAISQQLKSKLHQPPAVPLGEISDIKCEARGDMDEEDENDGLVIDEEKGEVEEGNEDGNQKGVQTKEQQNGSRDEGVVDLASVSRLLDNATTQNQAFQQYFQGTQDADGEEEGTEYGREEASEDDEEGLVAGSNSEGNNSGSDENRSESDINPGTEKKKSAYSLAPNRVACPYCLRKFPWSSSLRRHVLTHTGQKPYKCPHCPLLFTTKSNCDRHLLRKHGSTSATTSNNSNNGIETSQGNGTPTGASNPSYTMRNVPERPFKCNFCPSSTFSTQSNLKKHVATKHGSHSCPTSPAAATTRNTYSSGDETYHQTTRTIDSRGGGDDSHDSVNEDVSDERLTYPNPVNRTTDIGEGDIESVLGHPAIDLRTSIPSLGATHDSVVPKTSIALEIHGSTTSSELPFKCHLCEGSYAERQEALDHIREHHPTEFDLLVTKGALEVSTHEENNGNSHITSQEEGNGGEENLEQLRGKFPDYANRKMCAFCLRRFWSAEDLRRHMRTHTGERPFSCDICRRRFTLKHSMLRHRKKHSITGTSYVSPNSEDVSIVSGDEDNIQTPLPPSRSVSDSSIKTLEKHGLNLTNHNNNTITSTKSCTWESNKNDLTVSSAQILSSKLLLERKDEAVNTEEDTDLIGNLLGIQDRSIIDKVLLSKSADDAAKLLGVRNSSQE